MRYKLRRVLRHRKVAQLWHYFVLTTFNLITSGLRHGRGIYQITDSTTIDKWE